MRQIVAGGLLAAFACSSVVANDFADARVALCERIKSCAMERISGEQEVTEQMRELMLNSLDNMCAGMEQGFSVVTRAHELYEPAAECMNSMSALSCESLIENGDEQTPQCIAFREKAKAYE